MKFISRRKKPVRSATLLRYNVRPRTAALTREKLDEIRCKTLEHPLYGPDLSRRDYHVFGPLEELGGHHDGVETFVRNRLRTRRDPFFDDEVKLHVRCEKCASKRGDCTEKQVVYKIVFIAPINVLKQKYCSYLIRPRMLQRATRKRRALK